VKIAFKETAFRENTLEVIAAANKIITEYQRQGFRLTVRQAYYQFVSRDWITNTEASYKKIVRIIGEGRENGLIDWSAIEDRTRAVQSVTHWESPQHIIEASARSYCEDKWAAQATRVEVWIEKEALAGVFEMVCERLDVALFPCRGYSSKTSKFEGAERLAGYEELGQRTVVIYFGDHDPSGIDMGRGLQRNLALYGSRAALIRVGMNMDQVEQYAPPPNFAKPSDSRYRKYQEEFGNKCWELDALDPATLVALVEDGVSRYRDDDAWQAATAAEEERRSALTAAAERWDAVTTYLSGGAA
jgi:hypothetical protein